MPLTTETKYQYHLRSAAWMGGIATLAAGLMLGAGLNDFSMWLDEVNMVRATLAWNPLDFATYGSAGHPPLYFMLLRGWIALAGQNDLALRALTLLTGLLTAAVVYRLAADLTGRAEGGAIATLVFGSMGFVKYYVHETHNYAQLMLMATLLLFFTLRWWAHPRRRVYAAGVVLSAAGLIYTHYYSIFFIVALNAGVLILAWRRWGDWARYIGLEAIAAVLYIPWLYRIALVVLRIVQRRANGVLHMPGGQNSSPLTIREAITTLLSDQMILYGAALALGIGGLVWLSRTRWTEVRRWLPRLSVLVVMVIGSAAIALMANRFYNTFTPRRIIYVLPALAALLGCLLASLPRWPRWAAALIVTGYTASYGWSAVQPGNWSFRQAVETVRDQLQPGDLVMLQATNAAIRADHSRPLVYYGETLLPAKTVVMSLGQQSIIGTQDGDDYFANHVFAPAVVTHQRFWVISGIDPDVAPASLDWVKRLKLWPYEAVTSQDVGQLRITLFERAAVSRYLMPGVATPSPRPLMAQVFGNIFELDMAQINRTAVKSGDTITIWLDWQAIRRPDQDYAVFVHLLADPTKLSAQADGDPLEMNVDAPTSFWAILTAIHDTRTLTIPPGILPGTYELRIGIYSRATGARLTVVPADGTLSDSLLLSKIKVIGGQ